MIASVVNSFHYLLDLQIDQVLEHVQHGAEVGTADEALRFYIVKVSQELECRLDRLNSFKNLNFDADLTTTCCSFQILLDVLIVSLDLDQL